VLHLALLDQFLHGSCDVFDGHVGIDAVLVEDVNAVGVQALQRCFSDLLDMLGAAVHTLPSRTAIRVEVEAELGGDHDLFANWGERLAKQPLIGERPIHFGRVKESDATIHGGVEERDHLLLVLRRSIGKGKTHTHAAKTERGNFEVAVS
jgi:hypothetical protein